jgi:hypothetical protein
MLKIAIFWGIELFALGACLFALAKGGVAERLAACVIILNIALGFGAVALFPGAVESFRLVNDGLAAVALLVLAVRYAAPWLGGAMFFYTAQFALHSYFLVLGLSSDTVLHANINNVNFIGINLCLLIGTIASWRRRVRLAREAAASARAA